VGVSIQTILSIEHPQPMLTNLLQLYRKSFSGLSREIWLLATVMLINRSGMMVMPFMSIYLTDQLHFNLTDAGIIVSFFGAGSVAGAWLGGKLTDRLGYYATMRNALFGSGLMIWVLLQMTTFWGYAITIFLVALIADTFRPANLSAIGIYSKPENRTRSLSLVRLAINLGLAVGPALGGFLAMGVGYEWMYWIDGATCIFAGFFLIRYLKPRPTEEEELVPELEETKEESVYSDGVFWSFAALHLMTLIAFFQLLSTVPLFWKEEMGMTEGTVGLLLALNCLIIVIIEMPIIYRIEKKYSTLTIVATGALMIGLGMYSLVSFPSAVLASTMHIVFITIGEIINFPFSNTFVVNRATPKTMGAYMGYYTMIFSVSLIIAPSMGMYVADHWGFGALWMLCGTLCLISFGGYIVMKRFVDRPMQVAVE